MSGARTKRALTAAALALALTACRHPDPSSSSPGEPLAPGDFHAADLTPLEKWTRLEEPPFPLLGADGLCPIVVADDAACVGAAYELAAVLHAATGHRPAILRVLPGQDVPAGPAFFVGDAVARTPASGAPAASADGFRVVASGGSVRFLGRADFAVYDWCERQLGVRCYGPSPADFSVPPAASPVALAVDYSDRPVFAHRDFGSYGLTRWGRFAKTGRSSRPLVRVHAPASWQTGPAFAETGGEIFAQTRDGRRGGTPMLCYGNPATLAYYCRRIDEHVAGGRDSGGIVDPKTKTISVSQWDAFYACACSFCRPHLDPAAGAEGYASALLWGRFVRRLAAWAAKRHPDYRLSILPYWNSCSVPGDLNLRRYGNTDAVVCVMPGLALFKNKQVRIREEERLRAWRCATGSRPVAWHYSCWPAEETCAPYVYGEVIRRHFRRMRGEIEGAFVCGGNDLPRHALSLTVWMRCLWNPDVDVQAIYDGYAARLFGPAAKPVREMIRLLEVGWLRPWPDDRLSDENVFARSYPPSCVARLRDLLAEAQAAAAGDVAVSSRLAALAKDWAPFFRRSAETAAGVPRPLVAVPRAETAPVVDGRLTEACWCRAPARAFVRACDGGRPWAQTTLRSVWTQEGIYWGIRCEEPAVAHLRKDAAQGDFLHQDSLSVLFDATGSEAGVCRHLMLDPQNRLTAMADTLPWAPQGVRSAVFLGDGFWSAELYLPFSALGEKGRPHAGGIWRMNCVRERLGDAWRPAAARMPGSCAEQTRLWTRFSPNHADRDAFLPFCFEKAR